jgi:hypothetical protein
MEMRAFAVLRDFMIVFNAGFGQNCHSMKHTILAFFIAIAAAQAQTKPAAPAVKLPPQAPDVAAEKFGPDG